MRSLPNHLRSRTKLSVYAFLLALADRVAGGVAIPSEVSNELLLAIAALAVWFLRDTLEKVTSGRRAELIRERPPMSHEEILDQ